MEKQVNQLRVAGKSSVKAVAGSITKSFEEGRGVEITAIGASSINQAVKSMALARSFLAQKGRDLYVAPGFDNVTIDGEDKTAIRFILRLM